MNSRNIELEVRLKGIFKNLWGAFESGGGLSAATKGYERELFISGFLSQVFPPHYRFSGGDIIDKDGHHSGQIDVVLEFPYGFSFPVFPAGPRLFIAENVAAAIEVKSDLRSQWNEVVEKARKVEALRRSFQPQFLTELANKIQAGEVKEVVSSRDPEEIVEDFLRSAHILSQFAAKPRIPFLVVGFEGWSAVKTVKKKLIPDQIDAIFVVKSKICVSRTNETSGVGSLMAFLELLEENILKENVRMPVLMNYRVGY